MDNLIHIETYPNEMEAQLAFATLEAAGIKSILEHDDADSLLQPLQFVKGVKLLVNPENVDEAKTILENFSIPTADQA